MTQFSTSNLTQFPEIDALKSTMKHLAVLNVILLETDWLRYHQYTTNWSENVDCAVVDNGSGDKMFLFFSPDGCVIKGFDHESPLSPYAAEKYAVRAGMYEGLPEKLGVLLDDVAVEKDHVTFCIWRENGKEAWKKGQVKKAANEDDGSEFLLGTIFLTATDFQEWGEDYFGMNLNIEFLSQVFAGAPITSEIISGLNPDRDAQLALKEINSL